MRTVAKKPIGIILRGIEARFHNYSIKHIRMEDLPELVNWPKYKDSKLTWANFSASTPSLQSRWYQNSVKPKVAWLAIRDVLDESLVARSSITQPENGDHLVFGIVMRPDLVNRGLGTDIIRALLRLVFDISEWKGVWLESHFQNAAARAVWEKIGFQFQGYHYRRSAFGEMDKFVAYQFMKNDSHSLPEIEIRPI